jgi:hypothetical protein
MSDLTHSLSSDEGVGGSEKNIRSGRTSKPLRLMRRQQQNSRYCFSGGTGALLSTTRAKVLIAIAAIVVVGAAVGVSVGLTVGGTSTTTNTASK